MVDVTYFETPTSHVSSLSNRVDDSLIAVLYKTIAKDFLGTEIFDPTKGLPSDLQQEFERSGLTITDYVLRYALPSCDRGVFFVAEGLEPCETMFPRIAELIHSGKDVYSIDERGFLDCMDKPSTPKLTNYVLSYDGFHSSLF